MFEKLERMDFAERMKKLTLMAVKRHNILPDDCHVGHLILEAFYDQPDLIHQIDAGTGENQTNLEVAKRSSQLAFALRNSGLKPADHAVIMGVNSLDLAMPFYASHYNGYAVCAMDPTIIKKDLVSLFTYVQPKIVFCTKAKQEDIQIAINSNNLKCSIVTFDGNYNIDAFINEFNGIAEGFSPAVFDENKTVAWLMLTSGTTGLPKVAMMTFKNLIHAMYGYWGHLSFRIEVILAMATIQWLSTLMFFLSTPLTLSTRLQTSKEINPRHLREIINKYKPTFTVFTPHILRQFLHEEGELCDWSSLLAVVIGGSVVQKSLCDQLQEKCQGLVINSYGMTELLIPIFRYLPGIVPEGSVGIAIPEKFKYKLIDEDGNDVNESNKVGELWVKGDSFFKGYLNNAEETKKVITPDGWVKTGDLFTRDDNDFYFFKERIRILIKYKSRFVAPIELEDVIRKHSGVTDVCVVGIPHPDYVQLPVAAIIKKIDSSVEPSEIFTLMKEELPELKQLHGGLFFVDALPMTASGKINRPKVLQSAMKAERILPQ